MSSCPSSSSARGARNGTPYCCPTSRSTTDSSSSGLNGFVITASAAERRGRSTDPVNSTMGMLEVALSAFSCAQYSSPSTPGIITSRTIASGGCTAIAAAACAVFSASSMSTSNTSKVARRSALSPASSSTRSKRITRSFPFSSPTEQTVAQITRSREESVLEKAATRLAAESPGLHVLSQQGAGRVLWIAESVVQQFHDRDARVEPDQIGQSERPHRVREPQLRDRVDRFRLGDAFQHGVCRLVNERHQDPVGDEPREGAGFGRLLAELTRELDDRRRRFVGRLRRANHLDELQHRNGVEEVHADHLVGPACHRSE